MKDLSELENKMKTPGANKKRPAKKKIEKAGDCHAPKNGARNDIHVIEEKKQDERI